MSEVLYSVTDRDGDSFEVEIHDYAPVLPPFELVCRSKDGTDRASVYMTSDELIDLANTILDRLES